MALKKIILNGQVIELPSGGGGNVPTKTSDLTNDSGFITANDNVASATKLANIRYLNGVPFDGSANAINYAVCSTPASTTAKAVSISRFSLVTGAQVRVEFDHPNTASAPTLNVGSTGAKRMSYKGSLITNTNFTFNPTKIYTFTYDGTYWVLEGDWDEAPKKFSDLTNNNFITCQFAGEVDDVIYSTDEQNSIEHIENWIDELGMGKVCVLDFDDEYYSSVIAFNFRTDATYGMGRCHFSYIFDGYLYDVEYESVSLPVTLTIVGKTKLSNADKQDKLVSGTNIKTVNGQSLLGSGNITIEGGTVSTTEKKSIAILFVGNSLTQDGIAYLPYVLKTYYPEIDFKIYMWYMGGKTLADHYSAFTSGGKANIFSVAENTTAWTNSSTTVMSSVLSTYKFDIVCMQEYFNYKESYKDCTDWNNCRDYITTNYKGGNPLKFISLFHAPLRKDGYDVNDVFKRTEDGNALILQSTISEDLIPNGIAVYRALDTDLNTLGDLGQLSPDGTHTQEGLPCLLQTWVTLLWLFDKLGINKSIYGHPMRMTTAIYNSISVPGANLGSGVVQGTEAQNLLAQEVAIKAYKEGKQFTMRNLYPAEWGGGSVSYYTFTIDADEGAIVKINGVEQSSITVLAGTTVNWEVSKEGYHTQSGAVLVIKDTTLNIKLVSSAELVSISAEFNQGERTIFNEDGLDELRKFLIVTKEYDNGMSEVTDDYTLTGELVGGTNAITVSVDDKSTTFEVNVTEVVIPSGYARYGYIQKKTTNKSQVAPSNFIYLSEYEDYNALSMEANIGHKSSSSSDTSGTLGARLASGDGINYYAIYWTSGSGEIKVRMRNTTFIYPVATSAKFAKIVVNNREASPLTIQVNDGAERDYAWTNSYVIPHPMCLFNNIPDGATGTYYINRDSQIGEIRFRNYDGRCVGYYIPVLSANSKIGMYDVISQKFHTAETASAVTTTNSGCYYSVGNW